jgi:uncharacterized protein DUF222
MGAAREKVRVARALPALPRLGGALQRGEISYAKVRALTRVATPDNEERLLRLAYHATASQVERVARAWRRCDRLEEAREDRQQRLSRSARTYVDDDGMVVLRARLTPELGAVVQRALDAAADRLYKESKDAASPDSIVEEVSWTQRQADALGLLAECALRSDLDGGTAGDRYQVVVHVDAGDAEDSRQAVVELDEGAVRVSAETSRRLACDAAVVVMRESPDGRVLDVGRRPGSTSLDNLMLLCRRHHTLVHEGGVRVERDILGALTFRRPDGRVIEVAPRVPIGHDRQLPQMGSAEALRYWDGTRFNLGYVIDVLRVPGATS